MIRAFGLTGVAFLAFVSLGLPDGVLGVAWPSMSGALGLGLGELGGLLVMAMVGYLVSAVASGTLVARIGVGGLLLVSSVVMVASSLGYALAPNRAVALVAALLAGLGGGAIDAGVNAYAARRFPARQVTWLHACYGIGATLGPLLITAVMTSGRSWRLGYVALAIALGAMTLAFARTRSAWDTPASGEDARAIADSPGATLGEALGRVPVWLNSALFFVYTGLEVTAGQWMFSVFTETRGIDVGAAGLAVSAYWASLTLGRVAFGALAAHHAPVRLLRVSLIICPAAALAIWWAPQPLIGFAALAALGFTFGPIYPLLVTLTPERVGRRYVTQAVSVQVALAYLGTAALPGAAGVLAVMFGLVIIPAFLVGGTVLLALVYQLAACARQGGLAPAHRAPAPQR